MTNTAVRGSAADRRRRKHWLLSQFGNGTTAPCWSCPTVLTFETLTVDRIIPGAEGGTYRRNNIRPQCSPCACRQGAAMTNAKRKAKAQ